MRSFDPRRVGALETRAWETYYRRRWVAFLVASVRLVHAAFSLSWPRTLLGAWLVLRANMVWAPVPDNDPEAARRLMTRFYRLLDPDPGVDPRRAAELEVEWWRVHREHQRADGSRDALVTALTDLYAYAYRTEPGRVRRAAELRAEAMDVSDAWVAAGAIPEHPLLGDERRLLVRSYAALLAEIH
jgi:hypothetical protein